MNRSPNHLPRSWACFVGLPAAVAVGGKFGRADPVAPGAAELFAETSARREQLVVQLRASVGVLLSRTRGGLFRGRDAAARST